MGTVTALKKEKQSIDLNAILTGAAKPKEKKSDVPQLSVPDEIKSLALEIRELRNEIESLTAICKAKEDTVIEQVQGQRESLMQSGYHSSFRIPDASGHTLMLSYRDQYSKIPTERADDIAGIVGAHNYEVYFVQGIEIKVRAEAAASESTLVELIGLVGADNFARFFEVERWIKPTTRYTTEFFTAFTAEQRQQLGMIVPQYKPAIKVK